MIKEQYIFSGDQTTSQTSKTKQYSRYIMFIAYTWLIIQAFVPDFPYKWTIFVSLVIVSNILIKNYMNIVYLSLFYAAFYMLGKVLPPWILSLLIMGMIFYVFLRMKKVMDAGVDDIIIAKTKKITAQIQLKACYAALKKGHHVDPELIKELEVVLNEGNEIRKDDRDITQVL